MKKRMIWIFAATALLLCFVGCAKEEPIPPTEENPSIQPVEQEPSIHDFPETLLEFEAHEQGVDKIDIYAAETLRVMVMHCTHGEPEQIFHDTATIEAAAAAIEKIEITGDHDGVDSTATIYAYVFEDAEGENIATFGFQEGMLSEAAGRYPIEGEKELFSIEGILLSDQDWRDYERGLIPAPGIQEE